MSEIDPAEIAREFTRRDMWLRCAECGEKIAGAQNGRPWCIICKKNVETNQ